MIHVSFDFVREHEHEIFAKAHSLGARLVSFSHTGPGGGNPCATFSLPGADAAVELLAFVQPDWDPGCVRELCSGDDGPPARH